MHVLSTYMIILATPKLACIMLNTPLYRPREAALAGIKFTQLCVAPARPLRRETTFPPRTMRRRGESRGGDNQRRDVWHPLWRSLLLSHG